MMGRSHLGRALVVGSCFWGVAQAGVPVTWNGKTFAPAALPAEMPEGARRAVELWEPWAAAGPYRFDLTPDARVMLVTTAEPEMAARKLKLVTRTEGWFDPLLPAASAVPPAVTGSPTTTIPEDPEGEPERLVPPVKKDAPAELKVSPFDRETIALFVLRNEGDYVTLLDFIAAHNPDLEGWTKSARGFTGFVLEWPLSGAYIESAAGMEEWNPDNEVVNRVAQLLLMRRFGQQPFWLMQGFAWCGELAIQRGIYCFPYRNGFVSVSEHNGWDEYLRNKFRAGGQKAVAMTDFAAWQRGQWDGNAARIAWGVVDWMTRKHASELPLLLIDLRQARGSRPELAVKDQRELFERRLGKAFLDEILADFRRDKG